ncbi:SPX domain-containing protein 1-like [Impatiens glandulifera]|uniref:SPX domain-containing protein 1-like n=1 Tax=Impatiens glandulifera TaxID=253017 RepID=UPI001FB067E2|nr:SPX domain-containing protein 1-like [Impatiens glandulifera]
MKFWRILSELLDQTLPGWRDNFLSYKDLKQQLNLIYPKDVDAAERNSLVRPCKRSRLADGEAAVYRGEDAVTEEVTHFVMLLENEINKFNSFFVDKEEGYIIRLKMLQDRVMEVRDFTAELMSIGREAVDFHGEMVLLLNYSALNYTGLVKILKKHDRRSVDLISLPFIKKVLQQPFFKTDIMNKLVKECETILECFFAMSNHSSSENEGSSSIPTNGGEDGLVNVPQELSEIKTVENMYMKQTITALLTLNKIRSGSSTLNMFSLPPMETKEPEFWKKLNFIVQEAK